MIGIPERSRARDEEDCDEESTTEGDSHPREPPIPTDFRKSRLDMVSDSTRTLETQRPIDFESCRSRAVKADDSSGRV
jgi:hypothetical protein